MLSAAVQFGGGHLHPGAAGLVGPLMLVACVLCCGAVVAPLLGVAASRSTDVLRASRGRRRRVRAAAGSEMRARATMSELCPGGWRAQITILARGDAASGAGGRVPPAARVALDWAELEGETGRPGVMRRVWAPTIAEALEAMVADRRTDEALEEIEQRATADGVLWPDR